MLIRNIEWQDCKILVFFFKQKTAYEIGTGDWSSDVCSSDLNAKILLSNTYGENPGDPDPSQANWSDVIYTFPTDRKSVV